MNTPTYSRREFQSPRPQRLASVPRLPVRLPDPSTIAVVQTAESAPQNDPVSDDQIAAKVHERIAELGEAITGRVVIRVHKGTIFVHGAVQSQYQRLVVTSALRRVRPDLLIRDRIEIVPAPSGASRVLLRTKLLNWGLRLSSAAALVIVSVCAMNAYGRSDDRGLTNVPVTVTADGQIANGAFLMLHPVNDQNGDIQVRSQGRVDEHGTVSWTTFEPSDGLLPGEYVVTATWNRTIDVDGELQPGPNLLPQMYEAPETSPMRLTVKANSKDMPADPVVLSFQ
ncbi:MAG: hypothetical protein H7Z17_19625 [Fuerstia sp.]|nr:hypothetical protein [Fuerstiella sp.]